MKYLTQFGSISFHKAALLLMIRERSASRSRPVSQAGRDVNRLLITVLEL